MSRSVKIYDTCIGCTQCVRACPHTCIRGRIRNICRDAQIYSKNKILMNVAIGYK